MVQTECKLNNTELSASNCFIFRAKKLETTRTTKEQQNLKNGTVRFRLNIHIRKEMEDSVKAECRKTTDSVCKRPTEFSSETTTAAKVPLTEPLLGNWLKNNHITVDKIINRKKEFCGNALKLDLIE